MSNESNLWISIIAFGFNVLLKDFKFLDSKEITVWLVPITKEKKTTNKVSCFVYFPPTSVSQNREINPSTRIWVRKDPAIYSKCIWRPRYITGYICAYLLLVLAYYFRKSEVNVLLPCLGWELEIPNWADLYPLSFLSGGGVWLLKLIEKVMIPG